jgi:hypothetical protein
MLRPITANLLVYRSTAKKPGVSFTFKSKFNCLHVEYLLINLNLTLESNHFHLDVVFPNQAKSQQPAQLNLLVNGQEEKRKRPAPTRYSDLIQIPKPMSLPLKKKRSTEGWQL